MEESSQDEKREKKVKKDTTFHVPLTLEEIKTNISPFSNIDNQPYKEQIINQASKFYSQGNIQEAARSYQRFIIKGCTDFRIFSNYGAILKDLGKLKEAELSLRKAIELKPNHAQIHSNLGSILKDLGKLKEAELSLRKAIELKPNFAKAYSNLGTILRDLGKLKEAELSLRKAIELKPDFAMAYSNLGTILRDLGKLKEAELATREAIKIKPDFAIAYYNLGNTLKDLGNLKEAELATRKAIVLRPDFGVAHSNLGDILSDLGKLDELILLSESTVECRSINNGYKLLASLRITIAYLIKENFSASLLNMNKVNKLISKGAVNEIKEVRNKNYLYNFSGFITALYPLLKKGYENTNLDVIPHIGESHCLSFAHQTLSISSRIKKIQPVLIIGGKAWHFANHENNKWKDSLTKQIKNHTYSDQVFISFGEIDCRKDEGILTYIQKSKKNISEVCQKTINGYLNHTEVILSAHYSKRYYFGIPAPTRQKKFIDKLDIKRIEIIKVYNLFLKKEVLSRGSYFLDVYELTSDKNGENNNIHMCDKHHLSPECLSILFEKHLYNH